MTAIGPRLKPRSGGVARQLVILLHGFGADGSDLIEIGRAWQPWLPDAAFFAPHAPEPCIAGGGGRQWFSLTFRDTRERWRGVNHAAPALDGLIDAELASHRLRPQQVALVGFSQGAMMALHLGLRRAEAFAAIVGLSGGLVTEEGAGLDSFAAGIRSRPPILLSHGDRDEVIPVGALFSSARTLAAADVPCEWHLSTGVAHGVDETALQHAGLFLVRAFGLPFPA
jgi:phospholipase/carboxylesterase